ncbi:hypothetical protein [Cellulosimicrobium sp. TH-20]|uniref:hypothetical protein n=1 Tax=Cellulosimicrobium sp. TH-20 TaxID=1980001 RepID=UPI001582D63E
MAMLSEFMPLPARSPAEVRNVVEVGHKGEDGYLGHDPRAVEGLFPAIQVLECNGDIDVEAAHRIFLRICVEECRRGASWISDELADGLDALADLAVPELPYAAIGRSIFDSDPRSMFMAVYRCIEATYAYESMRRVVERLGLTHSWQELARALELEVGWHPQEASSLNLVLVNALDRDLVGICECLGVEPGQDLRSSTGKAIYRLRNEIVHFRPGVDSAQHQDIDWNRLCSRMIDIVFHTFTRAYVAP